MSKECFLTHLADQLKKKLLLHFCLINGSSGHVCYSRKLGEMSRDTKRLHASKFSPLENF